VGGILNIKQLNTEEVYEAFNSHKYIFVDVREPSEWRRGCIPRAKRISFSFIQNASQDLDKNANYILVCRSGRRSSFACHIFYNLGIKNVSNYSEGMLDWYDKDYPIEIKY
jgi:rhodanese-related sulfurtransferase